jgi:hypothetical protein
MAYQSNEQNIRLTDLVICAVRVRVCMHALSDGWMEHVVRDFA